MIFTLDLIHGLFRIDSVAVFNLSGIGRGMGGGGVFCRILFQRYQLRELGIEELLFVSYSSS